MAHKKAAGSAKNLRDSQPKYRGVKLFGGQKAVAGNIIIRQNGSKYECGQNTYLAADFTIHASIDGVVVFKKRNFKRFDGRTYLKTVVAVFPVAPQQPVKKAESVELKAESPKPKAPVKESVMKEPVTKEPVEKKPVSKKPAAEKPATKKPAVKKPATEKAAKAPAKKATPKSKE